MGLLSLFLIARPKYLKVLKNGFPINPLKISTKDKITLEMEPSNFINVQRSLVIFLTIINNPKYNLLKGLNFFLLV